MICELCGERADRYQRTPTGFKYEHLDTDRECIKGTVDKRIIVTSLERKAAGPIFHPKYSGTK